MHCWQTPQSVPAGASFVLQAPEPLQVSAPEHVLEALLPQGLPDALFAPSTHTDDPVEQDVIPALHGVGFPVQAIPGVQAPHMPALQ